VDPTKACLDPATKEQRGLTDNWGDAGADPRPRDADEARRPDGTTPVVRWPDPSRAPRDGRGRAGSGWLVAITDIGEGR
jgi:hypothetical protein